MRGAHRPLEANREREKEGGGGEVEWWWDEVRRRDLKSKSCNASNTCNDLPSQKQEGNLKLFNSGNSRWNFSWSSKRTAPLSLSLYFLFLLHTSPQGLHIIYKTTPFPFNFFHGARLREEQFNRSVMQHFSHPTAFIRASASPDLFVIIAVSTSGVSQAVLYHYGV